MRRRLPISAIAALVVSALVAMPIVAIFLIGLTGGSDNWQHMITNVVPRATNRTLLLLALTGALTASIGIVSAWLVASCDFPFRRLLSVALVLPLANPSYLAA